MASNVSLFLYSHLALQRNVVISPTTDIANTTRSNNTSTDTHKIISFMADGENELGYIAATENGVNKGIKIIKGDGLLENSDQNTKVRFASSTGTVELSFNNDGLIIDEISSSDTNSRELGIGYNYNTRDYVRCRATQNTLLLDIVDSNVRVNSDTFVVTQTVALNSSDLINLFTSETAGSAVSIELNNSDGNIVVTKTDSQGNSTTAPTYENSISTVTANGTQTILDNSVITSFIVNNAVTTAKIANDAVSTIKVADNSITSDKQDFLHIFAVSDNYLTTRSTQFGNIVTTDLSVINIDAVNFNTQNFTNLAVQDLSVTNQLVLGTDTAGNRLLLATSDTAQIVGSEQLISGEASGYYQSLYGGRAGRASLLFHDNLLSAIGLHSSRPEIALMLATDSNRANNFHHSVLITTDVAIQSSTICHSDLNTYDSNIVNLTVNGTANGSLTGANAYIGNGRYYDIVSTSSDIDTSNQRFITANKQDSGTQNITLDSNLSNIAGYELTIKRIGTRLVTISITADGSYFGQSDKVITLNDQYSGVTIFTTGTDLAEVNLNKQWFIKSSTGNITLSN